MRRGNLLAVAALLALSASSASSSAFTFVTDPADGLLSGATGTTVGYGYTIVNPDPTLWLVTTNFSAGTFAYATGTSLFDFPMVAPGQTVFLPYDPLSGAGLYEIFIDGSSPPGYVNLGAFVVSGEFDRLDPDLGLVFAASADDQIAQYQITATSNAGASEPRLMWVAGLGLAALLLRASAGKPTSMCSRTFSTSSRTGKYRG